MNLRASRALVLGILATAGFGVACAIADTTGEDSAYGAISNRNAFHLNPAPSPAAPVQKTVDLPKLVLSGFYKVGGNTRVLLAMPPRDQTGVTKYFNLAPGERDTPVEVVKISAEKGEVDIINSGMRMTLSLASNGAVAMAAPSQPAGGAPPVPGMPGGKQARTLSPGVPQPAALLAAAATPATSGNSAVVVSGGDSGSLAESANGSANGGAIIAGRNSVGGGNSGAPSASGNSSSTGGVIVAGGNSAIGSIGSYNGSTAGSGTSGAVYVPPIPESTLLNAVIAGNAANVNMSPASTRYPPPLPITVPQGNH